MVTEILPYESKFQIQTFEPQPKFMSSQLKIFHLIAFLEDTIYPVSNFYDICD